MKKNENKNQKIDVVEPPPDLVISCEKEGELEGWIIFYLNVGQLPPFKAEAFIERTKECYAKACVRVPKKYDVLFMPFRGDEPNWVELLKF